MRALSLVNQLSFIVPEKNCTSSELLNKAITTSFLCVIGYKQNWRQKTDVNLLTWHADLCQEWNIKISLVKDILTSSVIYYWTDAQLHLIYFVKYTTLNHIRFVFHHNIKETKSLSWELKTATRIWKCIMQISCMNQFFFLTASTLVLSKSYWAIMNKISMYARPCSIKWREQFSHFSCKISVAFSASSFV